MIPVSIEPMILIIDVCIAIRGVSQSLMLRYLPTIPGWVVVPRYRVPVLCICEPLCEGVRRHMLRDDLKQYFFNKTERMTGIELARLRCFGIISGNGRKHPSSILVASHLNIILKTATAITLFK